MSDSTWINFNTLLAMVQDEYKPVTRIVPGISIPEAHMLAFLYREGEQGLSALARHLHLSVEQIGQYVNALEKMRLLERVREKHELVLIRPTAAGLRAGKNLACALEEADTRARRMLTDGSRAASIIMADYSIDRLITRSLIERMTE